jgi:hypothetical protein
VAWISASTMSHHISTLCCRFLAWGLPDEKTEVTPVNGDDLDFHIFCADRLAAVSSPLLSVGAALSRGFSF